MMRNKCKSIIIILNGHINIKYEIYIIFSICVMTFVFRIKKINKPGVSLGFPTLCSPNGETLDSAILYPGLVLELLAAKGEHLLLFAGIWDIDSQSKFLFRVAHAIFLLHPTKQSSNEWIKLFLSSAIGTTV